MVISAFSFCASSGRPPARYWAAESLRCLIIEPITETTSESSRGFAFSISRYFIWLLSIRSVLRRRASLARAAVFMSESIWSESMYLLLLSFDSRRPWGGLVRVFFDPGLRGGADSRRLLGTLYVARGHHCMVSP